MTDELVAVHDVGQEYWYVDRHPCSCGGRYRMQMQILQDRGGTPVDRLITECDKCGSSHEFLFDISAFHGLEITIETMRLLELVESETDEQIKMKVLGLPGSPVAKAINTIHELGKVGDHLALDWLEDAIRHARAKRAAR